MRVTVQTTATRVNASSPGQPRTITLRVPGPQGLKGDTGTSQLGSVTVVNPNVNPSITQTGTPQNAVYNFSLPRTSTFAVGTVSKVDADDPATVNNVGANGDVILDFNIPQGDAATLNVGTITVVNPDQQPDVSNSGTTGAAVLDFDLPRASDVSVGSVATGTPSTPATVTDSGTGGDVVLDFTIPEGVKGDKGDQGDKGDKGDTGDTGTAATLDVGTVTPVNPDQSPTVTNSGTTAAATFDFGLPRAATFAVGSVTTGAPTDPAAVSDVGTDGDVVLDFTIPQGVKGDKGDPGDATTADLDDLADVVITTVQDGDLIVFDTATGNWVNVSSASVAPVQSVNGDTGVVVLDSDDVAEGAANLYYTDVRADARIAAASLDDLSDVLVAGANDGEVLTYSGADSRWESVVPPATMPVGGGTDKVFFENDQLVTASYTISAGKNALAAGPLTFGVGVTVTVPDGAGLAIV